MSESAKKQRLIVFAKRDSALFFNCLLYTGAKNIYELYIESEKDAARKRYSLMKTKASETKKASSKPDETVSIIGHWAELE